MTEWIYVDSSNIEAVQYNTDNQELYVQFLSGGTYCYHDVPEEIFNELLEASSKGSFLNRVIKGTYEYSKVS